MNPLRSITLILIMVTAHVASAQIYMRRWIDFRDSVNSKNIYGPHLGEVLLHGFLDGELEAYSFDYKSEDVKFKPIPKELIPDTWNPKLDYFMGDRVTYKGEYFECLADARRGIPPEQDDYWWKFNLQGEVVSTIHSFPTAADITTKQMFLSKFIEYEDEFPGDPWMPDFEYYTMDVAYFNGVFYNCLVDNRSKQPDTEKEYWEVRRFRLQFNNPHDLYFAGLLYAVPPTGITSAAPQMLSVNAYDYNRDVSKDVGLNFKFQDVMNYLARQKELPLVCRTRLGYAGSPQILVGYENAHTVLQFLQSKLMEGKLIPGKKDILDAVAYKSFAGDMTEDMSALWTFTQDMTSNAILIGAVRYETFGPVYTPVVRLPWKTLEPLFKAKVPNPAPLDFMTGLQSNQFNGYLDTLLIDTLETMPYKPVNIQPPAEIYFVEQRSASTTGNPVFAKAMQSLWDVLSTAALDGQIELKPSEERPFACDQPFPAMTIESHRQWTINEGFQLDGNTIPKIDSMYSRLPVAGIIPEYERTLTMQGSRGKPSFQVKRLGVRFFYPEPAAFIDYFFRWEDVKKIVGEKPDLQKLVEAIGKGKLTVDTQVAVGGLMGRGRG